MKFSSLISLSFLISLFATSSSVFSMNLKSSFLKKSAGICATIGTGALTFGHYYYAFEPTGLPALEAIKDWTEIQEYFDSLDEPNQDAQRFIKEQLAIQGVKNSDDVRIKRVYFDKGDTKLDDASASDNIMFVHSYYDKRNKRITSRLETTLEKNKTRRNYYTKKKRDQELAEQKFIYRHEANHVYFLDTRHKIGMGIAIPLITESVFYLCKKPFSPGKRWIKNLLALPLGIAKGYGNLLLFKEYQRQTEQRADDKIVIDDQKVLQGGIHYFKKSQEKQEEELFPLIVFANKKLKKEIREELQKLTISRLDEHPPLHKRIECLKERLREGEK